VRNSENYDSDKRLLTENSAWGGGFDGIH